MPRRPRPFFALCLLLAVPACSSENADPTATSSGAPASHTTPDEAFLPKATGPCPEIVQGKATFSPDGKAREVELFVGPEAGQKDGPLVFFWHGAGGSPTEATYALGDSIAAILAEGGIVAAPYHDPAAGQLPWYLSLGGTVEDDIRVADEILACVKGSVGLDLRHVHSVGFSAGAMHTTQFAAFRSGYLASIVVYSGARLGTPNEQDEKNLYPAMLFEGGPSDQVIVNFETMTNQYHQALTDEGHFSFICAHTMGHTVPADARASAYQFLKDHPFGATPEPYSHALPAGFPAYCAL